MFPNTLFLVATVSLLFRQIKNQRAEKWTFYLIITADIIGHVCTSTSRVELNNSKVLECKEFLFNR